MRRRLPPLNALRAFEAAARHLSFTLAAEELAVTQAAISHQVKTLEEYLGLSLFVRQGRNLKLTSTGISYLAPLSQAFDTMDEATRLLHTRENEGALKVSVLPSFATKWLLPRLPRFRQLHPELDVLVSAREELQDLEAEDIDLGIRFGYGNYEGLKSEWMMADRKYPVCSPKLLEGHHSLNNPQNLKYHTLLQDDVYGGAGDIDWKSWLTLAGIKGVNPTRGPGFSDSSMVLAAAIAGQGVALARSSLARDDIAAGLLVQPFGPEVVTGMHYFMVFQPDRAHWQKVCLFKGWLKEEARLSTQIDNART